MAQFESKVSVEVLSNIGKYWYSNYKYFYELNSCGDVEIMNYILLNAFIG